MPNIIKTSFRSVAFLFFVSVQIAYATVESCGFKDNHSVYLFSGTLTASIYRLGLFDDPQIKGLMGMYQFKPTKKKIFSGGIYLSQKLAEEMENNAIIFHEESNDLETTLKHVNSRLKKNWILHKLNTLRKSPYSLSLETLDIISTYLKNNPSCQELVSAHRKKIQELQINLESKNTSKQKPPHVYFFMGNWQGETPEAKALVIYQEGFVFELLKNNLIAPYTESELKMNYTPWSAKKFFNEDAIYIGIVSELEDHAQSGDLKYIAKRKYHSTCFGCLIPGIFQLEWMSRMNLKFTNQ